MGNSGYKFGCDRLRSALREAEYMKNRECIGYDYMTLETLSLVRKNTDCLDEDLLRKADEVLKEKGEES